MREPDALASCFALGRENVPDVRAITYHHRIP